MKNETYLCGMELGRALQEGILWWTSIFQLDSAGGLAMAEGAHAGRNGGDCTKTQSSTFTEIHNLTLESVFK